MDAPLPRPFEQAFRDDCPYHPEALLLDRLLEIDHDKSLVRCSWPTTDEMPLTRSQRTHPIRHPRHVAGGLMVHATGMLGFVHAYYIFGLRHSEGWVGYGTHIHRVVFRKLVTPGTPIECVARAARTRVLKGRKFVRYEFEFKHEGEVCYEGEQTAVWMKLDTPPGGET
ncbi:MAG: hypothetical protein EXR75_00375 [Myxococcales bacterium]|nr:hypothetical protein [Myxococcales bacterium]